MTEIDGVLKNWKYVDDPWYAGGVYIGRIHSDRKGRFDDGTFVHTSRVVLPPDKDGIVKSRNSVYRLEPYAPE